MTRPVFPYSTRSESLMVSAPAQFRQLRAFDSRVTPSLVLNSPSLGETDGSYLNMRPFFPLPIDGRTCVRWIGCVVPKPQRAFRGSPSGWSWRADRASPFVGVSRQVDDAVCA